MEVGQKAKERVGGEEGGLQKGIKTKKTFKGWF